MKHVVLKMHHDTPSSGHRGPETTLYSIVTRYFWPYLPSEVRAYCRSCIECQHFNYKAFHPKAPLKQIVSNRPWQLVGIDVTGPFKTSKSGNEYIIVAVDHFSKFCVTKAVNSFSAEITAKFIFDDVICRFGPVEQILTDHGVNFESKLLKHLCFLCGIDKLHSTTYHPMGNGLAERMMRTLKPSIAKFVNDEHDDWDTFVQLSTSAYNSAYHASIQMTPYEAVFGRKPVLLADVVLNNQLPHYTRVNDVSKYVLGLRENATSIIKRVKSSLLTAQAKQKSLYDNQLKYRNEFAVGDLVMINNTRQRPNHSKAFEPKFIGPYKIVKSSKGLTYDIISPVLGTEKVHYNRLYRFYDRFSPARHPKSPQSVQNPKQSRSDPAPTCPLAPLILPLGSRRLYPTTFRNPRLKLKIRPSVLQSSERTVSTNTVWPGSTICSNRIVS